METRLQEAHHDELAGDGLGQWRELESRCQSRDSRAELRAACNASRLQLEGRGKSGDKLFYRWARGAPALLAERSGSVTPHGRCRRWDQPLG